MLWDVWALAAESDLAVLEREDGWATLRPLVQEVSRTCVRRARYERPLFDPALGSRDSGTARRREMNGSELLAWEAAALASLSHQQRVVVDLRYRYGLPDDVIAKALDICEATVRVHAMRGLGHLREFAKHRPPQWARIDGFSLLSAPSPTVNKPHRKRY
jgi:hypothetical protein